MKLFSQLIKSQFTQSNITHKRHFAALRKVFWKEVTVTSDNGNGGLDKYEINLDGKKLKTPLGSVLKINSRPLAAAVANEWRSQKDVIRPSEMHLTSLCNTVIDNPMRITKERLIHQMIEYLISDTLIFRVDEPLDLKQLQENDWDPVIEWFMNRFDVDMSTTTSVFNSPVTQPTQVKIEKHLYSYNEPTLIGMNYMTENLKSLMLTLSLMDKNMSIERAVALSRLETEFQVSHWGNVEWHHDLDLQNVQSRVAAGFLFSFLNSDFSSDTLIKRKI